MFTTPKFVKKIWASIRPNKKAEETPPQEATFSQDHALDQLESISPRLDLLEENLCLLSEQMKASADVIKNLSEQSTNLVQYTESNRLLLRKLFIAIVCFFIIFTGLVAYLLTAI